MMLTSIFAIITIATCAVALTAPSSFWSLRYACSDVGLFLLSIACYYGFYVLSQRRKDKKLAEAVTKEVEPNVVEVKKEEKPQFDVDEHVALMQKYASERNIGATMRTFRSIQKSADSVSSHVYNIVLQAFINCGNVQGAEDWMETIIEADKSDESSFSILIKGLVEAHALDKARDLLAEMRRIGIKPSSATFDELLMGFARAKRFTESLTLLETMHAKGVQHTSKTLHTIEKLLNDSRNIDQSVNRIRNILQKFNIAAAPSDRTLADLPRLAAIISQTEEIRSASCSHEVDVTGSLCQIKAVRKTLKQQGFLDDAEKDAMPLDGHWETDDGLTVVIEGKLVRWGGQHASRLRFVGDDRRSCMLTLYGKPAKGESIPSTFDPQATKALRWDNGDTWHSYDGRAIGQDTLFSQSMTKPLRDKGQDEAHQERACAVLRCVSKDSLGLPSILEENITQFLGGDLFHIRVQFQSKWNPSCQDDDEDLPFLQDSDADICSSLSRRHPRVGFRHCWVEPAADRCGQRTLVNGSEVDEDGFGRQIGALRRA